MDDVPWPATSEAEALRGRRSRWTGKWPDRLLPPFLCARLDGIWSNAFDRAARTVRYRRPRRRCRRGSARGLQARANAERGAHGFVARADETQLSAHVDALFFVRPRILAREAVD